MSTDAQPGAEHARANPPEAAGAAPDADPLRGRKCSSCGKTLPRFGRARANGKQSHGDWKNRSYHKTCWKRLKQR
jgi:hypothetical protein